MIKNVDLLHDLTETELTFLSDYLTKKIYSPGEVILHQGTSYSDLYIIESGEVSVSVILPGNTTIEATRLTSGQIFGEVAFLAHTLITATIAAVGTVECIVFYGKILNMLRIAYPETAYKIELAIAKQTNSKLTGNLVRIKELLRTIPVKYRTVSQHAQYLPDPTAMVEEVEATSINRELIKHMDFFLELTEDETTYLLSFMSACKYDKGYRFNTKNAPGKLGLICSGAIMLFITDGQKLLKSLAVSGVGELFMQNFLSQEFGLIATYVTCEKSITLELTVENYMRLRECNPYIFYAISQHIHGTIAGSLYIVNRQFVRMNSEYKDLLA